MATLEEAYKANELDNFFSLNQYKNDNEFKIQFSQITNLPAIEKSFIYKKPLMDKYNIKRENIIPIGETYDYLMCLLDTSTNIYYTVNMYELDVETGSVKCGYLFLNDSNNPTHDMALYKNALINKYNISIVNLYFLGITYKKMYCFLDISTKTYYTVNPEKDLETQNYNCKYLFINQDPEKEKKKHILDRDTITKLFI